MHMSFWWDYDLGNLYIDNISINSVLGMVLTCIFMTILSIIFEGLKVVERKIQYEINDNTQGQSVRSEERNNLLNTRDVQISAPGCSSQTQQTEVPRSSTNKKCLKKILRFFLFSTNNTINYLLMLAIMLYNGFLAISIIAGIFIGHFLFGHIVFRYNYETYLRRKKVVCAPDNDDNENGTTPPLVQINGSMENDIQTYDIEVHSCVCPDILDNINISVMKNENDQNVIMENNENIDEGSIKNQEETC